MKKLILIIVVIAIIIFGIFYFTSINSVASYQAQSFYIEKGDGAKDIGDKLVERKIINNKFAFLAYSFFSGKSKKFVPGEHALPAGLSVIGLTDKLTDTNNINKERNITILEGWSLDDIGDYLAKENIVSKADFMSAADFSLWREKYNFLQDPDTKSLEGFLFPDTYRIFIGTTADKIIAKMLDNFGAKVTPQMIMDARTRNKSFYSTIILASIIEREAKYPQDKKNVADVFLKRIEIGMPLQSDATINYLTKKGETRPKGADLEIDSPYNTYKYKGLPPGPISNPGLDSINATIYPQANDYYYFLTDQNGKAIFAKTYDEHKANIAKYLD